MDNLFRADNYARSRNNLERSQGSFILQNYLWKIILSASVFKRM